MGWRVTERFGDPGDVAKRSSTDEPLSEPQDPAALNAAILDALNNGASGLWLTVGPDAIGVDQLAAVLDGVLLDLIPVTIDAGAAGIEAARVLAPLLPDTASVGTASSFGLAPLTAAYSGRPALLRKPVPGFVPSASTAPTSHWGAPPMCRNWPWSPQRVSITCVP
jgi:methylmalonyl-CoA mutase